MAQKLPLRYRILHFMSDGGNYTVGEVMDALKEEYGTEGQFNKKLMETHLASLKAVGMVEYTEVFIDEAGELIRRYKLTEYGFSTLVYLPSGWEPLAKSVSS